MSDGLKPFWISWWLEERHGEFELHSPWWRTGYGELNGVRATTVCAAVRAADEADARDRIKAAYDVPPSDLEFSFVEERPANWSPFGRRYEKAAWMQWGSSAE